MSSETIHIFRYDLRLMDNPALSRAAERGPARAIYICPDLPELPKFQFDDPGQTDAYGGASRIWLHHALASLDKSIGGRLSLFTGDRVSILTALCAANNISHITITKSYLGHEQAEDEALAAILADNNITLEIISGHLLWEPEEITKADGTPYRVFTPFYRRGCLSAAPPRTPLSTVTEQHFGPAFENSVPLTSLKLMPEASWADELAQNWDISESGAHETAERFFSSDQAHGLSDYAEGRNMPAQLSTSRLSPYLKFGQISVNRLWYQTQENALHPSENTDVFLSELGWREFSYSLLYQNPTLRDDPIQAKFSAFDWENTPEHLDAWKRGMTGYPIVDAGMRELYQTGYMHNRLRMIVGSFLVKNLLLDWRDGEAWFWDCLFDADPASNRAGWQWIAGCGADAAPYFRVFNPITQGQKFDPDGRYTRKFVPELARLPDKYLFNPFDAPPEVLRDAGVQLGKTYPRPLVDVKQSRLRALDRFAALSA